MFSASTASGHLAKWAYSVTPADLSPNELHFARRTLLDTVGVAIAGRNEPASVIAVRYALSSQQGGKSSIWADGVRTSPEMAALANGTMSHVLDFDDVSSPQRGHPSVVLWPAITALAEAEGIDEIRAMCAYVIGLEIVAKLGRLIATHHVAAGWHSTSTIGAIGASLACSWLLELSDAQMTNAIGIALAHAAGTRENFGTMSKSLHAGIAASASVRAASLAKLGFDAGEASLDGPAGFVALYANGAEFNELIGELGKPFEATRSAVEIKRYPMCYATHRAVDGVLEMKRHYGISLDDVVSVEVKASNKASLALVHAHPRTSLEAKFSMQYAVAAALSDGVINLGSFNEDEVARPELRSFLPNVFSTEDDGPVLPRFAEVRMTLKDGRSIFRRIEDLKGSPQNPLSDDELLEKIISCCDFAGSPISVDALSRRILAPIEGPITCDYLNAM